MSTNDNWTTVFLWFAHYLERKQKPCNTQPLHNPSILNIIFCSSLLQDCSTLWCRCTVLEKHLLVSAALPSCWAPTHSLLGPSGRWEQVSSTLGSKGTALLIATSGSCKVVHTRIWLSLQTQEVSPNNIMQSRYILVKTLQLPSWKSFITLCAPSFGLVFFLIFKIPADFFF